MDEINKIVVKKVLENDNNSFSFDDKHVKHGDKGQINSFFKTVKREVERTLNNDVEVDYLKSLWYKMRKRFVEVNLKKSRGEKVSPAQELFYEYLIFLEDHITHKNDEVYRSINKREIIDKIFDHLMGNTFEDVDDVEDIIDEFNIEDFPDAREILHPIDNDFEDEFIFPDTENLEMLEGYEEVVIDSLLKTRKSEEVKQIEKEEASILVAENVIKLDKLKIIEKNKAYKTKEYPVKTAKNPLNKLTNKPLVSLIDEPKKK